MTHKMKKVVVTTDGIYMDNELIPATDVKVDLRAGETPKAEVTIANVDVSVYAEYIAFCRLNGDLMLVSDVVKELIGKDGSIRPEDVFPTERLDKRSLEDYSEVELAEALARKVKARTDQSDINYESVQYHFSPNFYDFITTEKPFTVTVQLVPENPNPTRLFIEGFASMQNFIHQNAVSHGWWDNFDEANPDIRRTLIVEKIALTITELAEAVEALRKNNPTDEHLPAFGNFEVELGDAIIRIMDLAGALNIDTGKIITDKHAYNINRPKRHGKAF